MTLPIQSIPASPERRIKAMMDDQGHWRDAIIDRKGNRETFIGWLPDMLPGLDFTLTKQEIANACCESR
jgi:hypothetical protein